MSIAPIHNEAALLIDDALVIADLHLGLELELRNAGINLPNQTNKILNKVVKLCGKYKVKKLIILGDVKHKVPGVSYQELKDVYQALGKILDQGITLEIILGNHDSNLRKLLPKGVKIKLSKGTVVSDVGLFHGHAYPSKEVLACKEIVTAHIHPVVALSTGLGSNLAEPCWVKFKSKDRNIIVMPAFNKLCGCTINANKKLRAPLSKIINFNDSSIYLLDGTLLGKLHTLIKK